MGFIVREYRPSDAATMRTFRRAILVSASRDYDALQTRVWADRTGSPAEWDARRMVAHTWVAVPVEDDGGDGAPAAGGAFHAATGEPVGFIDVDDDGYIDMLFVDPSYGRRGCRVAAVRAGGTVRRGPWHRRAACPCERHRETVLARHGFHVVEARRPMIGDVAFVNYLMVRP